MATTQGRSAKRAKVWKGDKFSGPPPARHIPWPEIFEHHISAVEGHTKMLEMVQKHTVEGTGNYKTITDLVNRGFEMLRQAKAVSREFVPPKGQREMVPLGSSSESMYPGYSPGNIEYGKAAGAVGQAIGDLKARGEKWEPPANGPEYKVGQSRVGKRKLLSTKDRTESTESEGMTKEAPQETKSQPNGSEDAENLYFIDTNPTPVRVHGKTSNKPAVADGEAEEKKEKKKRKNKKGVAGEEKAVVVETDDISAEVNARLKAKEERAQAKEKKRMRESTGDESEKIVKKPKKEKSKKRDAGHGEEGNGDSEGKKKRKKNKDTD